MGIAVQCLLEASDFMLKYNSGFLAAYNKESKI